MSSSNQDASSLSGLGTEQSGKAGLKVDADERVDSPCESETGSAECQNGERCHEPGANASKCQRENTVRNELF